MKSIVELNYDDYFFIPESHDHNKLRKNMIIGNLYIGEDEDDHFMDDDNDDDVIHLD